MGMATYLTEFGDNRAYLCPLGLGRNPGTYNGAEWLASLYWAGTVPDPWVFLCPSSGDDKHEGRDIGTSRASPAFGSQTVSYAAMHYRSMTDNVGSQVAGAIFDDFAPSLPMASDDTQGTINHGAADTGGMCILFFDSHVDRRSSAEIDIEHAVGQKGGLLWQLRN